MPGLRDESNSSQVFRRGCKHVSLSRDQRSAKRRIQKVFLRNFPGGNLPDIWARITGLAVESADPLPRQGLLRSRSANGQARHRRLTFLNSRGMPLRIQPSYESVLNFMRVAQNIALVEVQYICKVVHASHVTVNNAWFDHVLPLLAEELPVEDLFKRRRANFHRSVQSLAMVGLFKASPFTNRSV